MKKLIVALCAIVAVSCTSTSKIYVVRHAEKLDNTPYSVLSPEGHARAAKLRDMLIDKKIDLIFATPFQRTQETAQPLAAALNKPLQIYRNNAVDSIAGALKNVQGKNILLVGHSGNLPDILFKITGKKVEPIHEQEYGNLYIIELRKKKAALTETNY